MTNSGDPLPPHSIQTTPLYGVVLYRPVPFQDERGVFVKTFHAPAFAAAGIHFDTREEFYSTSARGVLRGMHFQVSASAHAKLVTCLRGRVLDVVLDLRKSEPTFGQSWSVELTAERPAVVHVPIGLAHGFLSLEDDSLVHYRCTTPHNPSHDRGIRWDSFGFDWPETTPLLSARDRAFPSLTGYDSPF